MSDRLFEVPETPKEKKLSPGRRLTLRQKDKLNRGIHPMMGGPLKDDGSTCGNCMFVYPTGESGTRRFYKCQKITATRGPGTDLRLAWPGCAKHEGIPSDDLRPPTKAELHRVDPAAWPRRPASETSRSADRPVAASPTA